MNLNISLDVKAVSGRNFEGHGSVFNNLDLGGDIVLPGAFSKSLAAHKSAGSMPQMFWMHKPDQVPGLWTEMKEDGQGLFVKGELVDTPLGNEMQTLLNRKAVRGLSIGYKVNEAIYDKDGAYLIKEVDLWEVSLVSLAMNPLAQVEAMKSRLSGEGEYVPTEREFEKILRDAGLSRKVAATSVARLYGSESCGMLDNLDAEDPEAVEILKSLNSATDSMWSEVFRQSR